MSRCDQASPCGSQRITWDDFEGDERILSRTPDSNSRGEALDHPESPAYRGPFGTAAFARPNTSSIDNSSSKLFSRAFRSRGSDFNGWSASRAPDTVSAKAVPNICPPCLVKAQINST